MSVSSDFSEKNVLILGAGVTGIACARSLISRGAYVTVTDDSQLAPEEFTFVSTSAIVLTDFDFILVSPGWKESHQLISAARVANKKIINEIDLAWAIKLERWPQQKWLALTGTNGKTTTVEMTAAAIRAGGVNAIACGNVGKTVIECVEGSESFDVLVLELSSFQLHWLKNTEFIASAILNIADDHTDWHGDFDAYARAKVSILDRTMTAILNGDDGEILARTTHWNGRKVFYSLDTPGPGEIGVVEELLVDRAFVADPQEAAMIAEVIDIKPTVPHNVSNALAAAGLARTVGTPHEAIRSALSEFKLGRHRIEVVAQKNGITWIDDSKATNPHAAAASVLSALSVIWIAGGMAKGADVGALVARAYPRIKAALLIGTDRELIAQAFKEHAPQIPIVLMDPPADYIRGGESNSFMEILVAEAASRAKDGDTVLLAPACASMDQFISYADRGDRFSLAVRKFVS